MPDRVQLIDGNGIRGFLHVPEAASGDGIVLTHGAGANCQAPLLLDLSAAFTATGFTVLRCDLPFRQKRPSGPPPRGSAEADRQGLRRAAELMRTHSPGRVFLGGHSYGGRQASMLAAEDPAIANALLLLSYPLHPPTKKDELRTAHFPELRTDALFVHGSRDGFGTEEELRAALQLIPARTQLLEIASAGHELISKTNRATLPSRIVEVFLEFAGSR